MATYQEEIVDVGGGLELPYSLSLQRYLLSPPFFHLTGVIAKQLARLDRATVPLLNAAHAIVA